MKHKKYLVIGNWKMYLPYKSALRWIERHLLEMVELHEHDSAELILCPSFESLQAIGTYIGKSDITLGAQDCSSHTPGAYTGEVAAESLKELGCRYSIVGHSERREYHHEENQIGGKLVQLINHHITPILCVGETKEALEQGGTFSVLERQIGALAELSNAIIGNPVSICIAYEPVWAIGTGVIPENSYLERVYAFLAEKLTAFHEFAHFTLLYGGSVNGKTCKQIKQVAAIEGFLVGKASTDFQELKNIVLSIKKS